MGTITTMTVFVWVLNVMIFMSQIAMLEINPESAYFSATNTVLQEYTIDNNLSMPSETEVSSELDITSSSDVSEGGTGIFFIDAIASVKQWIQNKINYFVKIVMGPYNILNAIPGLPKQFVGLVSLIWYATSILLLVLTIFGRAT